MFLSRIRPEGMGVRTSGRCTGVTPSPEEVLLLHAAGRETHSTTMQDSPAQSPQSPPTHACSCVACCQ